MTFGELIALIFLLPIVIAGLYSLIVVLWIFVDVQERAQRILDWIKERKE